MKVLSKFTIKNLKLNKKRTIVTGIGIALSAALICAVSGMVTSVRQTIINSIKQGKGDWHTEFVSVPKDELKYIEENNQVESYFLTENIGWSILNGSRNAEKPYLRIIGLDKEAMDKIGFTLIEGRMPVSDTEVVVAKHITSNGGVELKLGETLILDVGTRHLTTGDDEIEEKPYMTGIVDDETGLEMQEEIVNTVSKTYTIVGIIERPNYGFEDYSCPGYSVITCMQDANDTVNIYVRYKDVPNYAKVEKAILKIHDEEHEYEVNRNSELLRYEGAVSDNTMNVLYGIAAVVIAIIVVSSVFVIRNSFSISVAEKNKQYGMLSSIGATAKQIRRSVLLEGLIMGLIFIPLGIILGMIAIVILIWVLNTLLLEMLNGITFVYSVPVVPILLTVLMSAVTIYLSCIIPARRASKISPIDSIRGEGDVKIKSKKLRTSKIFNKIFGIGGIIAKKNLIRSKKKYRTTIISLVVSISIFVSLSSFLSYGMKTTDIYYADIGFNVIVRGNKEAYDRIVKLDNVDSFARYEQRNLGLETEKYLTSKAKEVYGEDKMVDASVLAANDETFKKYIKGLGLNEENYATTVILVDELGVNKEDGSKKIFNMLNIKEGDTLTLGYEGYTHYDFVITKRTDKMPLGNELMGYRGTNIFVSETYAKNHNIDGMSDEGLYINSKDSYTLEEEITKLKVSDPDFPNVSVTNYDFYVKQNNRMFLVISIFLYGFIGVITLIGVTNIFNTITTNMILRSKEFAMLKSIGMTTKEFNHMITLESLLYGIKSLIIGLPIGIIGSYAIYVSFAEQIDLGYILPISAILISIAFVFVIVGITMKHSLNQINKQNIIETIRKDNI